jgi:hypothetical protein
MQNDKMTTISTPSPSPLTVALSKEASRIEEDTQHSAKSHFNACETWSRRHYWLGVPATLAAASAGAAFVKDYPILAQLLIMAATILSGMMTFLKPNEKASQHKAVGNQYLALRNDARIFREIELLEAADENRTSEQLKKLAQRRNELNSTAPPIPRVAFEQTRKGVADGETDYKIDKQG